jgi:nicotinate-nucleotide adenylyltransferase
VTGEKDNSMAIRLGVLGGSFNPIHLGHLHIAQRSREIFGLAEVLFVVASIPPHKPPRDMISYTHRYAMVSLATSGIAGFLPSQVELEAPSSPFTIETLAKLARNLGVSGKELYFLAGGDSLVDVTGWHDHTTLLLSYNFVFVMRPGVQVPSIDAALPQAATSRVIDARGLESGRAQEMISGGLAASESRIFLVEAGAPEIAASQIRRLASLGQRIDPLVPAPVHEYILKQHLYGGR